MELPLFFPLRQDLLKPIPWVLRRRLIRRCVPNPWNDKNDRLQCLFVHVPRTGGTSLANAIFDQGIGHPFLTDFVAWDQDRARRYFKFAVVRNPWDRLVSAYGKMCKLKSEPANTRGKRRLQKLCINSFSELIDALENSATRRRLFLNPIFRTQTEYLNAPGCQMDYIGRFEELDAVIHFVQERLGFSVNAEHLNASALGQKNYRDYYDTRSRRIVGRIYAEDVRLFSYEF